MTWNELIKNEKEQDYYANHLAPLMRNEYENFVCYPAKENIFKALYSIKSPEDVKVVIIGQDPYHEPGQAMGLSFSVPTDVKNPPSLQNIIKEIQRETNISKEFNCQLYSGDLTFWAEQGVLLLNSTLTVRKGNANSHANSGWQTFTDHIIQAIDEINNPVVYMLWGKFAQNKMKLITGSNALVLTASHPSPFSANRGFFGCDHFIKCNGYLRNQGLEGINWFGKTIGEEDVY